MTPSKAQYFFAGPWLWNAWLVAVSLGCALFALWLAGVPSLEAIDFWLALWLAGILVVAVILGFWLAILLGWVVLGPIMHERALKNGAPFKEGDVVRILVGPHRNRVVRVYQTWGCRNQVRVELGEQAKLATRDVFSFTQVCREEVAEPDAAPEPPPAGAVRNGVGVRQ